MKFQADRRIWRSAIGLASSSLFFLSIAVSKLSVALNRPSSGFPTSVGIIQLRIFSFFGIKTIQKCSSFFIRQHDDKDRTFIRTRRRDRSAVQLHDLLCDRSARLLNSCNVLR